MLSFPLALALFAGVTVKSIEGVSVDEYTALRTLYNQTSGNHWENKSRWMTQEEPCTWFGVACMQGDIWEINLSSNNLSGFVDEDLFCALRTLRVLNLENNPELNGTFTSAFTSLLSISYLNIDATGIRFASSFRYWTILYVVYQGETIVSDAFPKSRTKTQTRTKSPLTLPSNSIISSKSGSRTATTTAKATASASASTLLLSYSCRESTPQVTSASARSSQRWSDAKPLSVTFTKTTSKSRTTSKSKTTSRTTTKSASTLLKARP